MVHVAEIQMDHVLRARPASSVLFALLIVAHLICPGIRRHRYWSSIINHFQLLVIVVWLQLKVCVCLLSVWKLNCKPQTADCELQTANYQLGTRKKLQEL